MKQFAKLISEHEVEFPPINKDGISNYNLAEDLLIADGYKEYIPYGPYPEDGWYSIYYVDDGSAIRELLELPSYEERLWKAKDTKKKEIDEKCELERENKGFYIMLHGQKCEFDTNYRTQSDLQAAALVTSTGATYPNWVTNNRVVLELTAEDIHAIFEKFFSYVSPLYSLQMGYLNQLDAATTIEEVEAIEVDYYIQGDEQDWHDVPEAEPVTEEPQEPVTEEPQEPVTEEPQEEEDLIEEPLEEEDLIVEGEEE